MYQIRLFILLGLKGRDPLLHFCLIFCDRRATLLVLIPGMFIRAVMEINVFFDAYQ